MRQWPRADTYLQPCSSGAQLQRRQGDLDDTGRLVLIDDLRPLRPQDRPIDSSGIYRWRLFSKKVRPIRDLRGPVCIDDLYCHRWISSDLMLNEGYPKLYAITQARTQKDAVCSNRSAISRVIVLSPQSSAR
jgi:hypothetical protein